MEEENYRQFLLSNLRQHKLHILNESNNLIGKQNYDYSDYKEIGQRRFSSTNPIWKMEANQTPQLISASFSLAGDSKFVSQRKANDPVERYKESQSRRLKKLKEHIETDRESHNKSQTRELWSEVKVEKEIMLLRRAR